MNAYGYGLDGDGVVVTHSVTFTPNDGMLVGKAGDKIVATCNAYRHPTGDIEELRDRMFNFVKEFYE